MERILSLKEWRGRLVGGRRGEEVEMWRVLERELTT